METCKYCGNPVHYLELINLRGGKAAHIQCVQARFQAEKVAAERDW